MWVVVAVEVAVEVGAPSRWNERIGTGRASDRVLERGAFPWSGRCERERSPPPPTSLWQAHTVPAQTDTPQPQATKQYRPRPPKIESHLIMSSMKPMALAAREPRGPAEMVFTRTFHLRPASKARTLVSDSSAALAELMPPP